MTPDTPFSPDSPDAEDLLLEGTDTGERREKIAFNGTIRPIAPGDTDQIRPILEELVRDSETGQPIRDEIERYIQAMEESAQGNSDRIFMVAQSGEGQTVGVMGLASPDEELRHYAETDLPIEAINAYVTGSHRDRGIGKLLYYALEEKVRLMGFTEVLVGSGPRYEKLGYPFWISLFGQPIAIIKNKYGPGQDAPVWRKSLIEN